MNRNFDLLMSIGATTNFNIVICSRRIGWLNSRSTRVLLISVLNVKQSTRFFDVLRMTKRVNIDLRRYRNGRRI